MSLEKFITFVLTIILVVSKTQARLYTAETVRQNKNNMVLTQRELMMDSIRKIEAVDHFFMKYKKSPVWGMSVTVFRIRHLYSEMVFLFVKCNRYFETLKRSEQAYNLLRIHQTAGEIEKLIEVVEDWDIKQERKKFLSPYTLKNLSNRELLSLYDKYMGKKARRSLGEVSKDLENELAQRTVPNEKMYLEEYRKKWEGFRKNLVSEMRNIGNYKELQALKLKGQSQVDVFENYTR